MPENLLEVKSEPYLLIKPKYLRIRTTCASLSCCLTCSTKSAPRILIFSIAMGADHSFYVKTIETHARAFLPLNMSAIGSV